MNWFVLCCLFFFFKQKTAYEMRISDWSSDVCSSDLDGAPDADGIRRLRRRIRAEIARDAGNLLRGGAPDRAAATSKTFRSLARICGAAPSAEGPLVARTLSAASLDEWLPKLMAMTPDELGALPGVSTSQIGRAHV